MWVADWVLAAAWAGIGAIALVRSTSARAAWISVAACCFVLASLKLWRWHADLYQTGREVLRSLGVYADRGWFKVVFLGVTLVVAITLMAIFLRQWLRAGKAVQITSVAIVVQAGFYSLLVFSLADLLPAAIMQPNGRTLLNLTCIAIALVGVLLPSPKPKPSHEFA